MRLFTQYVAWQNFTAAEFAQAQVAEAQAEAEVKYVEAQNMVGNWSSQDKVTVARAEMALAPEVNNARKAHLQTYANRKLLEVVYGNCERCAQLVSRELTRRGNASPLERRQQRWTP
jgi:RNA polymerase-binding transcription factor DksA